MKTLEDYLNEASTDEGLVCTLLAIAESVRVIGDSLEVADEGKVGTTNEYGEEQLALDVLADKVVRQRLEQCGHVGLVASEETAEPQFINPEGEYAVCHDPLDGSSLVDVNLSIGSIFAVYKAKKLEGLTGEDQLASVLAVYGPRTTIFLTVRQGVFYFVMDETGKFILKKENLKIAEEGKMFAPGNLRACKSRKEYLALMNYWCENEYTLRYSGGFVPDIGQILLKGKGIFTYPGYDEAPEGKLRLLYECAPVALMVEQAGGIASDGQRRILEKPVTSVHQRTPILVGSRVEVEKALEFLATNA